MKGDFTKHIDISWFRAEKRQDSFFMFVSINKNFVNRSVFQDGVNFKKRYINNQTGRK